MLPCFLKVRFMSLEDGILEMTKKLFSKVVKFTHLIKINGQYYPISIYSVALAMRFHGKIKFMFSEDIQGNLKDHKKYKD